MIIVGTDPLDADTDDGGVNDGDEVANGTDPNDPLDGGTDVKDNSGDCGCASSEAPAGLGALTLGLGVLLARRRRR